MSVWRYLAALLFLCSCAAYRNAEHRAWRRDGACGVVCDYATGYMSAARTVNPFVCRCMTPAIRELNAQHAYDLEPDTRMVRCCGGCAAEAKEIIARQPWRKPKGMPEFDDPIGQIMAEMRQ